MLTITLPSGLVRTVSSGQIDLPLTGIWMADVKMGDQVAPDVGTYVTATLRDTAMPAMVATSELVDGIVHMRLIGGKGGLGNTSRPKHYHAPLLRHVLADLLRDAGETLSPTSSASVLSLSLEAWTTLRRPTGATLAALCAVAGANWRVLPDGTVWIGVETWPESTAQVRSLARDGAAASNTLGTDGPEVWPGTTLNGRRVDGVIYDLETNRTSVLYAEVQ
jgi:hypothetical protein